MSGVHITRHAIARYRERVADLAEDCICAALSSPAILLAADFGAIYVRLAGGQRVVVVDHTVVTVWPADPRKPGPRKLWPRQPARRQRRTGMRA